MRQATEGALEVYSPRGSFTHAVRGCRGFSERMRRHDEVTMLCFQGLSHMVSFQLHSSASFFGLYYRQQLQLFHWW